MAMVVKQDSFEEMVGGQDSSQKSVPKMDSSEAKVAEVDSFEERPISPQARARVAKLVLVRAQIGSQARARVRE